MTWLNPAAFAFLAAIPVILLLHSLRYRRRDVQVSTLFLWEQVMREAHGSLGLRRLIQNLPLILQILLALLLTLALANPALTKSVKRSKDIVLVLDASASMQTQTPQGTRFELAKQHALDVVQALPSGRQMAIIAAGRQPQVVTFYTDEKALLRQSISQMQVTDAPGNMREAILLALSFTQGRLTQEVVVIGDGAYRQLADLELPRSQMRHIRVAGGEDNVGIVRLAFRKVIQTEPRYEVLIAVKNFSPEPREVPLQLTLRRRRLLEQQLKLEPGEETVIVTEIAGRLRGAAHAEILVEDALELDNHAYGVIAAQTQTWVLLVGQSNFFLEQLLTSIPGVQVNVAPDVSEDALPQLLEANHLMIFNGVRPPPLQRGRYLLINTVPHDPRVQADGVVQQPAVIDWERQHPLLQFVELSEVQIEESLALQPLASVQSLIDGDGFSLMSVIDEPSLRVVTLGFDLMRSDLPLRVAFPVLINNLLRWLHPEGEGAVAGQVQAGTPYPLFFETSVSEVSVQDPQGSEQTYEVQSNPWLFSDARQVGVYIFRYGESKRYLTVNLLDAVESDIAPAEALSTFAPSGSEAERQAMGVVQTPLWPYLLLLAMVAGFGEWLIWCRDW
ncbi:vWA domain-containing protein [Candidatus Entotheonella palauensis]|uniref:vWA domain-containing protein n=1 Tax=Candidatus Entotheonella palauensis TaxID=93172 RepID=UPI000B7EECCC|nr:BatA and WFA domain-containing protein [Candidatus Entotheonella palauensis]